MQENPTSNDQDLGPVTVPMLWHGRPDWLMYNWDKLRKLMPETWTHIANLNMVQIGFHLKLLGLDWRSQEELASCMAFFERCGLILRDGMLIRVKP